MMRFSLQPGIHSVLELPGQLAVGAPLTVNPSRLCSPLEAVMTLTEKSDSDTDARDLFFKRLRNGRGRLSVVPGRKNKKDPHEH